MAKSKSQKVDPIDLEILEVGKEFVLSFDSEPVLTQAGFQIRHNQSKLLEHMISEFESDGYITIKNQVVVKPKKFSAYALYSIQKQFVETKTDNLTENFAEELSSDPILFRSPGSDIWIQQTARYGFSLEYLHSKNQNLPTLTFPFDDELRNRKDNEALKLTKPSKQFTDFIRNEFENLPPHRKVVAVFLHNIHSQALLSSLMLAKGKCSPSEYANAVITSTVGHTLVYGEKKNLHQKEFNQLEKEASTALAYITAFEDGDSEYVKMRNFINDGEGDFVEFKTSARNPEGERERNTAYKCLRAITTFLNTNGGNLLVGVKDNGEIVGIEKDGLDSHDQYKQYLANKIKSFLEPIPARLIKTEIRLFPYGKSVCMVNCEKAQKPVFLKHESIKKFFIRNGSTTVELLGDAQDKYIKTNFAT